EAAADHGWHARTRPPDTASGQRGSGQGNESRLAWRNVDGIPTQERAPFRLKAEATPAAISRFCRVKRKPREWQLLHPPCGFRLQAEETVSRPPRRRVPAPAVSAVR